MLPIAYQNLAVELEHESRLPEAVKAFLAGYEVALRRLGPEHPVTKAMKASAQGAHESAVRCGEVVDPLPSHLALASRALLPTTSRHGLPAEHARGVRLPGRRPQSAKSLGAPRGGGMLAPGKGGARPWSAVDRGREARREGGREGEGDSSMPGGDRGTRHRQGRPASAVDPRRAGRVGDPFETPPMDDELDGGSRLASSGYVYAPNPSSLRGWEPVSCGSDMGSVEDMAAALEAVDSRIERAGEGQEERERDRGNGFRNMLIGDIQQARKVSNLRRQPPRARQHPHRARPTSAIHNGGQRRHGGGQGQIPSQHPRGVALTPLGRPASAPVTRKHQFGINLGALTEEAMPGGGDRGRSSALGLRDSVRNELRGPDIGGTLPDASRPPPHASTALRQDREAAAANKVKRKDQWRPPGIEAAGLPGRGGTRKPVGSKLLRSESDAACMMRGGGDSPPLPEKGAPDTTQRQKGKENKKTVSERAKIENEKSKAPTKPRLRSSPPVFISLFITFYHRIL